MRARKEGEITVEILCIVNCGVLWCWLGETRRSYVTDVLSSGWAEFNFCLASLMWKKYAVSGYGMAGTLHVSCQQSSVQAQGVRVSE